MTGRYWDADPDLPSDERTVSLQLPDLSLQLRTDRGVFGASAVDRGTRLLLRLAAHPAPATAVLDLGTGYGPIAAALAHRQPDAGIWAVDVNRRALTLTRRNTSAFGNVVTSLPGQVPAGLRFDALYSNPPIKIGKQPLHDLLTEWLGRLDPGGTAWLVVKQAMGADTLHRWLIETGHRTDRAASKQGYRLLKVIGPGARTPGPGQEDLAAITAQTGRRWRVMGRVPGLFDRGIHLLRCGEDLAAMKVRTGPGWTEQFGRTVPVTEALRAQGYPTPAVLGTGALGGDRAYLLTEWVPGAAAGGEPRQVEALLEAARIHDSVHPSAERDWSAMITAFLNGGIRDVEFDPALQSMAERTLALLPNPVPALPTGSFVHGDFAVANALFRNGELRGIVDLEGCGRGTPAIDHVALAAHVGPAVQRRVISHAVEIAGPEVVTTCLCHRILAGLAWAGEHRELLRGAAGRAKALLALVP